MKQDPLMGRRSFPGGRVHTRGQRPLRPLHLRIAFLAMFAIAGFYLLAEHRAHLVLGLTYLPLLLLAACPLLHAYGHAGHGGHGHRREGPEPSPSAPPDANPHARGSHSHPRHGGDLP